MGSSAVCLGGIVGGGWGGKVALFSTFLYPACFQVAVNVLHVMFPKLRSWQKGLMPAWGKIGWHCKCFIHSNNL